MCPPFETDPSGGSLLFGIACFCATSAYTLGRPELLPGRETGLCGQCRYDLAGLAPGSCCPECGSFTRETTDDRTMTHVAWDRVPRWLFALAAAVTLAIIGNWAATELLVQIYRHEGFSEATARHVIPMRELRWGTLPYFGPYFIAAGFVPLLTMLPRCWSYVAVTGVLAVVLAMSLSLAWGAWS